MGAPCFSSIFAKRNNFSDVEFGSLDGCMYDLWVLEIDSLTLLHSEQPKPCRVLAVLSAIGLNKQRWANNENLITVDYSFCMDC